jgi:hypothetical protein
MSQARLEASIANAHRVVWAAAAQAERRHEQGAAEDLHQIADELRRVGTSLMRRGPYRREVLSYWDVAGGQAKLDAPGRASE